MIGSRPKTFLVDRTVLVDKAVQGNLMLRVILYWLFCVLSMSLLLLCWEAFHASGRGLVELLKNHSLRYGPAISVSLLLMPIVMFDVLRMSNRFLRPVAKLKQCLTDVADGRPAQPLNFRDDKFWAELAATFNKAAARISRDASERYSPTEEMPQPAGDSAV
jgi:hypothetical protein